jgi:tripartite-type tricarboxylate transporter receptor subunit TctC
MAATMVASNSLAASARWIPDKNVEIIAASNAGGGLDVFARLIQKAWLDNKIVEVPVNVVNKAGGGGSVAWNYLNQHAGDGHYLAGTSPTMLTGYVTGSSSVSYADITPVSLLVAENNVFSVAANASIQTGRQLLDRLRKGPESVNIGLAPGLGNHDHIALALVVSAAGVDPKKLKTVIFGGGGDIIAALLGGHVDLMVGPAPVAAPLLSSGKLKILAITADKRAAGVLAGVPTWKEQGIDVVVEGWRGVIGPKGMKESSVAYWEDALAKMIATDEWKKDLERNMWESKFLRSAPMNEFLKVQTEQFRRTLSDLGLAKR